MRRTSSGRWDARSCSWRGSATQSDRNRQLDSRSKSTEVSPLSIRANLSGVRFPGPAATLLLVASVLVHWPFGVAEFAYDDLDSIQVNASIRSLSGAWDSILAPFPPDQPERGLYRPLTNLSSPNFAVAVALVFSLHPVHTAAVDAIAGRRATWGPRLRCAALSPATNQRRARSA